MLAVCTLTLDLKFKLNFLIKNSWGNKIKKSEMQQQKKVTTACGWIMESLALKVKKEADWNV